MEVKNDLKTIAVPRMVIERLHYDEIKGELSLVVLKSNGAVIKCPVELYPNGCGYTVFIPKALA